MFARLGGKAYKAWGASVVVADEGATNALAVGCPMAENSGLAEAFTFNLIGEKP